MEELQTEEQQVEELRKWWQENARAVMTGVALAIVIVFGWRYWIGYQNKQAEAASALFDQVMEAGDKHQEAKEPAAKLEKEYPRSAYATLSALEQANQAVEQGNLPEADKQLRWAAEHGPLPELKQLAKVRLARVLTAQGKPQDALDQLNGVAGSYGAMADEARGDALLALGKRADARAAYQKALLGAGDIPGKQQLLQMKIDDLAGVSP